MKIQNVIIMLGPPGSGKGTQGKSLADYLKYDYFSMGQYLRNYDQRNTQLAHKVKEAVDNGIIIPDDWMEGIFAEAVESFPDEKGIVIDGFPRDLDQAPIMERFVKQHQTKSLKVVFMEVKEEDLLKRIAERGETSGRADDDPSVLHKRFTEYESKTLPLKKYFEDKGMIVRIDGNHPIEEVQDQIRKKLGV